MSNNNDKALYMAWQHSHVIERAPIS